MMSVPLRILVAEDNEALRRILDRGLRAHGFEVASFNTSTLVMRKEQMLAPLPPHAANPVIAAEAEEVAAH